MSQPILIVTYSKNGMECVSPLVQELECLCGNTLYGYKTE